MIRLGIYYAIFTEKFAKIVFEMVFSYFALMLVGMVCLLQGPGLYTVADLVFFPCIHLFFHKKYFLISFEYSNFLGNFMHLFNLF